MGRRETIDSQGPEGAGGRHYIGACGARVEWFGADSESWRPAGLASRRPGTHAASWRQFR